jgi:hypothetical protein
MLSRSWLALFLSASPALLAIAACHSEARHPPPPPRMAPPPPQWGPPAPPPQAACVPEGSYACAPDRIGLLVCRGGHYVVASTCRGVRGCQEGSAVACDTSVALAGDPCDNPGSVACGTDRRTLLRCLEGRYAFGETCRNACLSTRGRVLCQ